MTGSAQSARRTVGLFGLLGLVFVFVLPLGEAPDEAAHAAYVDHVLREGRLPPRPERTDHFNYEAHQMPLAYLVDALILGALGFESVPFPAQPNPQLRFDQPGSRAFLPRAWTLAESLPLYLLRLVSLLWGLLTAACLVGLVGLLADDDGERLRIGAAVLPFLYSPQLLFASTTLNNDSAAIALTSAALLGLGRWLVAEPERQDGSARAAWGPPLLLGVLVALAFFTKATALLLLGPVAVVAGWLVLNGGQRRPLQAAALLLPVVAGAAGILALSLARFGTLWPPPPGDYRQESLACAVGRLLAEPGWLLSLWGSFWAKFGWFNLPLPWPCYLLFLPPTLLALGGLALALPLRRRRASRGRLHLPGLFAAAVVANGFLLLAFLLRVAWQPQGRFLLPSILPLAGLAAWGLRNLPPTGLALLDDPARLWRLSLAVSCGLAIFSAGYVWWSY